MNKEVMAVAQSLAMSYLQGAIRDIKDDQSDTRNYFKIYCDSEPNEIAEKIYQMCGSREKLIEVRERIGEYIESESEGTTDE